MTKLVVCAMIAASAWAQEIPLATLDAAKFDASIVEYRGQRATRLAERSGGGPAVIKGTLFHNGTIEVELAGAPGAGASGDARGFVGIAFRVQGDGKFECIYLRPTNGRADDQLRRNHSAQYVAEPEWPWHRLRKESPGVYESYVDLEPGVWTQYKIVVRGTRAELYVHGASQPALIVKDLKLGDATGSVALWLGPGTDAHYAKLKITPAP